MPYATLPYPVSRSPSPARSHSDISDLALPSPLIPVDPRPFQDVQLIGLRHSAYASYVPRSGPSSPLFYPEDHPHGPPTPAHDCFGDRDYPPRSLLLAESLPETLHTALSIDIADELGIVVVLPPTFSRPPQWETTPYAPEPDPSPEGGVIELLAYGPHAGVNPRYLSDAAFMIEIRDEERLRENIGEGLTFRSLRHMLEAYYELLYGSS
ncbi:hypothetical protein BBK36DRAFT_1168881 [Trichoderma citrinoviride]|uniref:Uncharacterized protein n=1 Tax=Trichoderma citrinoviride TaxID=58853 RepID=A0A2T4BAB4_9HYPO|nr:hypothetical protein BBK36DRAFT_1168881 [Trichoderma citrinoviride]PTB66264.1 hypothetical protein BBK36DRAFT_1168881 [Trichoderma citrinoviride]